MYMYRTYIRFRRLPTYNTTYFILKGSLALVFYFSNYFRERVFAPPQPQSVEVTGLGWE